MSYTIRAGDTLYGIALKYNTNVQTLLFLNPTINPFFLVVGDAICVPRRRRPPCPNGFYYTVQSGDTLYSIARRYNVSVREIQNANPSLDPFNLIVGDVLCIPRRQISCPGGRVHTVNERDTLLTLATTYNVSFNALSEANPDVDFDNLRVGQQICIPPFTPSISCPGGRTYIIRRGDTLSSIAENFVVSATEILKLNPTLAPGEFVEGILICLPEEAPV
ncbi:Predicted glycosyl hydrolase [Maledivibacter halophilus]|uniref:Predicted glycosyl hydrolase n=2 Tax=Maledivibacter halophilus TaxID=36842 RepID=A0A1T5MNJ9_9FIRM|nr:Predicted glycosyl hydrolase [Maledivibacter halophilus]